MVIAGKIVYCDETKRTSEKHFVRKEGIHENVFVFVILMLESPHSSPAWWPWSSPTATRRPSRSSRTTAHRTPTASTPSTSRLETASPGTRPENRLMARSPREDGGESLTLRKHTSTISLQNLDLTTMCAPKLCGISLNASVPSPATPLPKACPSSSASPPVWAATSPWATTSPWHPRQCLFPTNVRTTKSIVLSLPFQLLYSAKFTLVMW